MCIRFIRRAESSRLRENVYRRTTPTSYLLPPIFFIIAVKEDCFQTSFTRPCFMLLEPYGSVLHTNVSAVLDNHALRGLGYGTGLIPGHALAGQASKVMEVNCSIILSHRSSADISGVAPAFSSACL